MRVSVLALGAILLSVSCKSSSHGHSHGEESHDSDHEHGHDHGHENELPNQSMTIWHDQVELFMEYQPLIVGRESKFFVHLTKLTSASRAIAFTEGTLTLTLVMGEKAMEARVSKPTRAGLFVPMLAPSNAGTCTMRVSLEAGEVRETFDIADCIVFADEASARAAASAIVATEAATEISFPKEQQWQIEFASAVTRRESIVPSKTVNATIKVVPGYEARLTAGTAGRLSLESPVPTIGSTVEKGQLLARIQPTISAPGSVGTLQADVSAATAEQRAAQAALARVERLVATDSVPKRRLEEAASELSVAEARLSAARTRLSSYTASASGSSRPGSGAFRVTSPIAGTLVEQSVTEGETTSAGALLFSVVDLDRVWVEGRIFEPDVPAFEDSQSAWFTVDGREAVFDVNEETGKLVTVGHVLDPVSRTVPVIYEVKNPNKALRIGQYAKLSVATGEPVNALVVPESAIVQDGNQTIVFVHLSGETFVRRVVSLGTRSRGLVEVLQGVAEGERVVTQGAYDVKLASTAGNEPAHGHAH